MALHSALSAGTYLAAKRALLELSPFELALVRFVLAGAVYAALLLRHPPRIPRRHLAALAVLGFVAVPLNQGFFLTGLARTSPGHAALLYALTPIFVFLLARARLGERATPGKLAGIGLAFGGTVVVLASRGLTGLAPAERQGLLGDLLVLVGVLAWAFYVVYGKPYAERYGAVATTGLTLVIGTLLYLPVGAATSDLARYGELSPLGWASVAYLVVVTSVVSYLIYYWALARAEASRVAIWSSLQPVLTALGAWAAYGERLTGTFLLGTALVLAGVVLTERG
jgi:drug/metabolite transporter (DMT)-like permease